ncbi:hypothetical protein [Streptomyces sp. HUAS TT20]|uniref:hypothetical protein n=1 Tax=Streptomyces sp. HUAS TT20 TaxID=3447509 RepID=UPI0021DB63A3|nr:hypothetical protein [Streptomyces sp. HUAS 15-9]UXY30718.1 hypothetical protein N8I87_31985 [Streptomyces sp. HUAS 15-9]
MAADAAEVGDAVVADRREVAGEGAGPALTVVVDDGGGHAGAERWPAHRDQPRARAVQTVRDAGRAAPVVLVLPAPPTTATASAHGPRLRPVSPGHGRGH